jgi:hypothetical protein
MIWICMTRRERNGGGKENALIVADGVQVLITSRHVHRDNLSSSSECPTPKTPTARNEGFPQIIPITVYVLDAFTKRRQAAPHFVGTHRIFSIFVPTFFR